MNCPKCGNELNLNMKFCAKCGTAIPQQPAQSKPAADATQKPAKQKKGGKKNLPLRIVAIVLVIAVLLTGGLFITDAILFKTEADKGGYITDFPVLKQNTEFLVYDAEKFPYENYNIKVDRFKTGKVFKSSTFSGFENVINERSNSKIFNIDFEEDGKYQITLEGIVSERTQSVPVTQTPPGVVDEPITQTPAESVSDEANTSEPTVIIIIVIVDDDDEDAVDKVSLDSTKDDKPAGTENGSSENKTPSTPQGDFNVVYPDRVNEVLIGDYYHTFAIKNNGTVIIDSTSHRGGCPYGEDEWKTWTDIVEIAVGNHHFVGLESDGTVVATGYNDDGQCNVGSWKDIVSVSAAADYTIGLKKDGTLVSTGRNSHGGPYGTENMNVGPCVVSGFRDVKDIDCDTYVTLVLKNDGTVASTPINQYSGIVCNNISSWKNIVGIAVGNSFAAGLKSDGTVVVDGLNADILYDVDEWKDIVSIESSGDELLGLKKDGTVLVTGRVIQSEEVFRDTDKWSNIVYLSGSYGNILGIKADGSISATVIGQNETEIVTGWKDIRIPDYKKYVNPVNANQSLEITSNDKEALKLLMSYMCGVNFDCNSTTTEYFVENIAIAEGCYVYEQYFDDIGFEYVGDYTPVSDPLGRFFSFTKMKESNVKWLCENVFNMEYKAGYTSDNSYLHDGYYYVGYNFEEMGMLDYNKIKIKSITPVDGKYEIIIDQYVAAESADGLGYKFDSSQKVVAEIKVIDSMRYWSIYSIQ